MKSGLNSLKRMMHMILISVGRRNHYRMKWSHPSEVLDRGAFETNKSDSLTGAEVTDNIL